MVVTVEHASSAVPSRLRDLGLPRRSLESHHGWDPGAALVGKRFAGAFAAPLHVGRWSRLVIDLNRSEDNPRLIPPDLHGGARIPGNADLTEGERHLRVERYWRPWRDVAERSLDAKIARHGRVLHVSVHSFVERLGGQERTNDIGLLYDPAHRDERALADRLDRRLRAAGLGVRRNFPYTGREDGFCMRMRSERLWDRYVGMEIELNQRLARHTAGARELAAALIVAFAPEVGRLAGRDPA